MTDKNENSPSGGLFDGAYTNQPPINDASTGDVDLKGALDLMKQNVVEVDGIPEDVIYMVSRPMLRSMVGDMKPPAVKHPDPTEHNEELDRMMVRAMHPLPPIAPAWCHVMLTSVCPEGPIEQKKPIDIAGCVVVAIAACVLASMLAIL